MTGKVVLITGCTTGGIGYELARAFKAAPGVSAVIATARQTSAMQGLEGISTLALDVIDSTSIQKGLAHVMEKYGRVDVLVNNAGQGLTYPCAEVPLSKAKATFDVNVWGALELTQAVVPSMMARRSGTIINIGSVAGLTTVPWAGIYSATKAALHSISDALRMELHPFNVHVMTVCPGAIKSRFSDNMVSRGDGLGLKLYASYEDVIAQRIQLSQRMNPTPADVFAKEVVAKALLPKPPAYFISGNNSWLVWFIATFAPIWLRDWLFMRRFGLLASAPTDSTASKKAQ